MMRIPKVFNREQVRQLIESIDEPWLMVAILLGMFCGLRINEVAGLRREDVDMVTKRIHVLNSKNPNRGEEGYGKDRVVPLPEFLMPVMRNWLDLVGDRPWLFPSIQRSDEPITRGHLYKQYVEILKRAGLREVHRQTNSGQPRYKYNFHTLRHTYATLLWEKTGDIVTVQHALGHSKLRTTMIYTHVSNKIVEQKVNEAFSPRTQLPKVTDSMSPISILQRKLALGEINIHQFRRMRQELRLDREESVRYIG